TLRHSPASICSNGRSSSVLKIAALFTRMSMRPNAFTVWAAICSTLPSIETSTFKPSVRAPVALAISAAAASWLRTSATTTAAPSFARRIASALPMPPPAPVTMAVFPVSLMVSTLHSHREPGWRAGRYPVQSGSSPARSLWKWSDRRTENLGGSARRSARPRSEGRASCRPRWPGSGLLSAPFAQDDGTHRRRSGLRILFLGGNQRRKGVAPDFLAAVASGVEHERADAVAHGDLGAHAVRPEAVDLAFLGRLGSHQPEGRLFSSSAGHRSDFHVARRVDPRALQHALQGVDRPGRCPDAQAFHGAQIASFCIHFPAEYQKPVHVLRKGAKQLPAFPVLERIKGSMSGAADEIEPALAQLFVGLGDGVKQLELRREAFFFEESHLDRGDRGEIRRRDQVRDGEAQAHSMRAAKRPLTRSV